MGSFSFFWTQAIRVLAMLALGSLLAGCKVALIVVEGGTVNSTGSGSCSAPQICIYEVNDTNYSESFTAVPSNGWEFVRWNSGGDFLCEDSTDVTCVVSNVGTAGNSAIEAIVASDATYYIQPVFRFVGVPLTDVLLTDDGKIWAQVDVFSDVSWAELNAVCPGGDCNGELLGFDLRDWRWASIDEVNELFNTYIGSPEMGPGPAEFNDFGVAAFYAAFIADGWRATPEFSPTRVQTIGRVSGPELSSCSGIGVEAAVPVATAFTGWQDSIGRCDVETAGAWLYLEF
ncbi:MAG: hypothetical protein AAGA91_16930 [Pseudomonadota bacterium]